MKTERFVGKALLFLFLFSICICLNQGLCSEISEPETGHLQSDHTATANKGEGVSNIGAWFASSVWPHISAVDGQRCPSHPTCSSYSARAFEKHGFFVGWLMTVDRLIHEADERSVSPGVRRDGQIKTLDPIENNDFWWYSEDGKDRN